MKGDCFEIVGGKSLFGEIENQISKNATLPILSACLLVESKVKILNYPAITDVFNMLNMLKLLHVDIVEEGDSLVLDASKADNLGLDERLSKTMRSSIFLLGSALSRFNSVMITVPGGCKIGARPIDLHIGALKKLKVKVSAIGDKIFFDATNAKANKIKLKIPSVGATENILQFACKLKGKTTIINPAREPEVVDLANFLNKCGAKILGAGTNKITIYGVNNLYGATYEPIRDRIVAGTIMCAVAICGGDVTITKACPDFNKKIIEKLCSMGCQIDIKNDIIHMVSNKTLKNVEEIRTDYYPGFPTDLQSLMLVVSCFAKGFTYIKENIFENRFLIVDELKKLGANITIESNKTAKIVGGAKLKAKNVRVADLRGGASLVVASLGIKGKIKVSNISLIDRGYDHIENMFHSLGADIRRI